MALAQARSGREAPVTAPWWNAKENDRAWRHPAWTSARRPVSYRRIRSKYSAITISVPTSAMPIRNPTP